MGDEDPDFGNRIVLLPVANEGLAFMLPILDGEDRSKVDFARGTRVANSVEEGAMSGTVPSSLMGVSELLLEFGEVIGDVDDDAAAAVVGPSIPGTAKN